MAAMRTFSLAITALSLAAATALAGAAPAPQASLNARLASCNPAVMRAAADELLHDPKTLHEPIILFQAAISLRMADDQEQAAFVYLAARLRVGRQLLFQQGDRVQVLRVMEMTAGPLVFPDLYLDPALARRVVERVIEWDRNTPDPFRDRHPHSDDIQRQLAAIDQVLAGIPAELQANRSGMSAAPQAQAETQRMVQLTREQECGPGRMDPVDLEAAMAGIETQVHALVRTDALVLRRAGGDPASVDTSLGPSDVTGQAGRFVIAVHPKAGRPFNALVDVQASVTPERTLGAVRMSLTCIRERENAPVRKLDNEQCPGEKPR